LVTAAETTPASASRSRGIATIGGAPARIDAWLEARRGFAWALVTVVFGLVALVVVVPAASGPGGVSPVDEFWYTDALDKANRGELTNTGDKVDSYARQVMVCRGLIGVHPPSVVCGVPQPDASLPLNGYTAADIHPPTYFFLTAAVGKVIRLTGVTDDLLIAGRLVGALWLTLGMLAMVSLGRAWGAGWLVPVLTAVATGTSPLLVSVSGYLTPDALGLLVGAGVLLAVNWWQRGRLPAALLLVAAVVPALVKVPFVLAPLFGALLLLVAGLAGQTAWRRVLVGAALLVGGAGAGAVLWQQLRGMLAVADPVLHPGTDEPVGVSSFVRYLGYYLEMIPDSSGAPIPVAPTLAVAVMPFAWLLLAAALGGILLRDREDRLLPVCWAGLSGMVLGSVVLSLIVLVASGGFLIGTPRYGLALLPLFAVPLMCTRHAIVVLVLLSSAAASVVSHALLW
jgi:hypothetical protein